MGSNRWAAVLWALILCFVLNACGGGGGGSATSTNTPPPANNPVPAVQSVSPSSIAIGATATVTVTGSNFVQGSTVVWNGTALTTTFVSSTQLTATIPASALNVNTGNVPVTVSNPSPGGGTSTSVNVLLENPAPVIAQVSPSSAIAGTAPVIQITGTGFAQGVSVQVGSVTGIVQNNGSTNLSVIVPAVPIGALSVTVTNPSPNAGSSNSLTFTGVPAGPGAQLTGSLLIP